MTHLFLCRFFPQIPGKFTKIEHEPLSISWPIATIFRWRGGDLFLRTALWIVVRRFVVKIINKHQSYPQACGLQNPQSKKSELFQSGKGGHFVE
jgi:hypothetical protein